VTYNRIESAEELPPEGPFSCDTREKGDLDFKGYADPKTLWEHAKDIAAFANSLGGVVLIGAVEKDDFLEYSGLKRQSVATVKKLYEDAAQSCSPAPVVDVIPIQLSGRTVVAVNVDPYVDQLVGAPADTRDKNGIPQLHANAWRYPMRRASQTDFINPEEAAMFMNRAVRRAVILLSAIPTGARDKVMVYCRSVLAGRVGMTTIPDIRVETILLDRNCLVLTSGNRRCRVPLSDIEDVWEHEEGRWAIRVCGHIDVALGETPRMRYVPFSRS
jgi:hypothetical protein